MCKSGLRILQLLMRTLNQEAGISSPDGVGWDWQHGTHVADPARPNMILLTTPVKGEDPAHQHQGPFCALKRKRMVCHKNPISNLTIHQQSAEYINYGTAKQSNTGVLVKINHQVL